MKELAAAVLTIIATLSASLQSPVPVSSEPKHHFKFENEYVRVYDVVVPPGQATLFHTHSGDYVFVTIGDANLKAEVPGAAPADLILKNGEVRFSKAPVTHRVSNPSATPFRNITVEVLKTLGSSADAPPLTSGHSAVIENERVRAHRLVLEPGQSTGLHTHSRMSLGVVVSGSKVTIDAQNQKPQTIDPKPGEFNWFAEKRTHSLRNVGSTRFEVVEIEWK